MYIQREVKSLLIYIKQPYFLWSSFWLLLISGVFVHFLWDFKVQFVPLIGDLYTLSHSLFLIIGSVCVASLIGILVFLINPGVQLNKQNLRRQPSWVFYAYWGTINSFIVCSFISAFSEKTEFWWEGSWIFFLSASLLIILTKVVNELRVSNIDLSFLQFAAGAVGISDDKLNFKIPARNAADGLLRLEPYVNVIGLYGGLGFGKSSYARMMIENIDPNIALYTYISLTETNEAKDFSKLFAERWLDTLSSRYPKIDITSYLPFMDSILRESGNGIFSEILKVISALNRGLVKTKAIFFDTYYSKKGHVYTTNQVARLFGNIGEIQEKLWIIMVDEIERAQFDEIYRLIEIIERFKNEGRCGLPIKLVFVFCISEPTLNEYLSSFASVDPRARLLKTFFYEDPKSINHKIFLPPVDPGIKQTYILDALNKIIDREGLLVPKEVNPHAIGDPSRSFMDHKDAAEYIIAILRESSPRVINRIVIALDFFYNSFKDQSGELQKNAIRFSDVLALEYIKIKYPYLIEFFTKTIHSLVNQMERHNIDAYFLKEKLEERKFGLIGWIESVTEIKIPEQEKQEVSKLVGLVMYYYFDFLNKDHDVKTKDGYFGTTSYPEIMCDYLSLMAEGVETSYRRNNRIYQKHKSDAEFSISKLDNKDLVSYARFLYDVSIAPLSLHIDIINELSQRIVQEKITVEPMNVGDTAFDEAIYQLTFQIVVITEKDKESDTPSENLRKAFDVLSKVLRSAKVNTGAKFIILSSFVNSDRGGSSTIHYRLESSFKKLMRHFDVEIRVLIKGVFAEADKSYFKGNKIIYKYEENFFYTLYQYWSGSKDDIEGIKLIRYAAKRGLKDYPKAIKLYWDNYPFSENWRNYRDVLDDDRFFSRKNTNCVYMPLETLIDITKQMPSIDKEIEAKMKFWNSISRDPKLRELSDIVNDESTLKSYLIRNGFL